jgi:hypothetical protein
MNKENALQFLPLIHALAEGKTIQVMGGMGYMDVLNPSFNDAISAYRIKPESRKSWYRVARKEDGVMIAGPEDNHSEKEVEGKDYFIEWLTGRIEYEIHEK